ncbi:MAG TPA: TetR/AcrR family transcriptional regulator [Solirubrobacterales bacterium]|nr:TetR/AcrR family transcriptional regulator [Solirubrobacterales bacterium]
MLEPALERCYRQVIDRSVSKSHPDTGARIRDAAVRLFAARGYAATGIREIADEAGVTTAALYHHMGSKQDLLLTIMRDAMHEMVAGARKALAAATTPPEELAGIARAHVTYNGENLLDAYVGDAEIRSLDPPNRARIVKIRDEYEALWAEVIARGVESGDFHIAQQKLFRIAAIQMCNGVTYWFRPSGPTPLAVIADEMAGFALAMAGSEHRPQLASHPAPKATQGEGG